ncbi:MAG: hypothetical protein NXI27_25840 [Alphaproteobacteria bacterium]|nr:hypothetical protein [Alphaproteobacteria bacterium]
MIVRLRPVVIRLFWPIVFLSWLPFVSSNMIYLDAFRFVSGPQPGDTEIQAMESANTLINLMSVYPHFSAPVATILLLLGLAGVITSRRLQDIVALLPLMALFAFSLDRIISGTGHTDDALGLPSAALFQIYSASYSGFVMLSAVYFCWVGMLTDGYFLPLCTLAFVDCVLGQLGSDFTFFGILLRNYVPSTTGLFLSVLAVFLCRSLILIAEQNRGFRARFRGVIRPALLRGFKLWWPMFILFFVATGFYEWVYRDHVKPAVVNLLLKPEIPIECSMWRALRGIQDENCSIETVLNQIISQSSRRLDINTRRNIDKLNSDIKKNLHDTRKSARQSLDEALPERFPGTSPSRCGILDLPCHLSNGIKSMMNSAYKRAKKQQLDAFERKMDATFEPHERKGDAYADALSAEATRTLGILETNSKIALHQVVLTLTILGYGLTLYAILVLFKSYLVVFARVLYADNSFKPLSDQSAAASDTGRTRKLGDSFAIANNSRRKFYAKDSAIGINVVERKRLPHWHRVPFARLITGTYVLCFIDTTEEYQEACNLKVDAPAELVYWDLKEGEEVVINFRDFIAMSSETRIASKISLRLSSLIFGKVIYHYAIGPGAIIMQTRSAPISGREAKAGGALNATGLVAWNKNNEYNVVSSLTIVDTFFSGCSIRKSRKNDRIIYDTSQIRVNRGLFRGIWRTARTFLLPI